jgi:hypothetical protein
MEKRTCLRSVAGNRNIKCFKSVRSQGILLKAETTQEQKKKEIKALSEVTDRKVNEFLNEDQKLKYKALNDESNKSRRKR